MISLEDLIFFVLGSVVLPFIVNCVSSIFMDWWRNRKN